MSARKSTTAPAPKAKRKLKPETALAILPQPQLPTLPQTPPPILNKQQTVNLLLARFIQRRDKEIADYNATRPLLIANALDALREVLTTIDIDAIATQLTDPNDITYHIRDNNLIFNLCVPIPRHCKEPLVKYNTPAPRPCTEWELTDARREFNRNIVAAEVAKIRVHLEDPAVCKALDSLIDVKQ